MFARIVDDDVIIVAPLQGTSGPVRLTTNANDKPHRRIPALSDSHRFSRGHVINSIMFPMVRRRMASAAPVMRPRTFRPRHRSVTSGSENRRFRPNPRLEGMGNNVFAAFSALALKHKAVNLGQGFPSFPAPDFLKVRGFEFSQAHERVFVRAWPVLGHKVHTIALHARYLCLRSLRYLDSNTIRPFFASLS